MKSQMYTLELHNTKMYTLDLRNTKNEDVAFVPRPRSKTSANAAAAAAEGGEEICSQPVVPYVRMIFDELEVAKQVYNDYAFKLGFDIRIGNTMNSQAHGVPKKYTNKPRL
jgi:hypothetical protein